MGRHGTNSLLCAHEHFVHLPCCNTDLEIALGPFVVSDPYPGYPLHVLRLLRTLIQKLMHRHSDCAVQLLDLGNEMIELMVDDPRVVKFLSAIGFEWENDSKNVSSLLICRHDPPLQVLTYAMVALDCEMKYREKVNSGKKLILR